MLLVPVPTLSVILEALLSMIAHVTRDMSTPLQDALFKCGYLVNITTENNLETEVRHSFNLI